MKNRNLLVVDFDGVIIDGMNEYWFSARKACLYLIKTNPNSILLENKVPKLFKDIRPWIHHGWEMVLMAAELTREDSDFKEHFFESFASNYEHKCQEGLEAWGWNAQQLQKVLDNIRQENISKNLTYWLKKHIAFPGVVNRLKQLEKEELELVVLTTKGKHFTNQILKYLDIKANVVYGHESGPKEKVLLHLLAENKIHGFIEDRRATLEKVINTPGLHSIPCYLAQWGYIKPKDLQHLPSRIFVLEDKKFQEPLAHWP